MARLGYSWGETAAERSAHYPCDELIPEPHQACYRAIDVNAPAPLVFRWLCQLRAAPYSYDWIDNLGRRSPPELTPGLDDVQLGQQVMSLFEIAHVDPGRSLTLFALKSIFGRLAITYQVVSAGDDRSRIVVKLNVFYPWRALAPILRRVPPLGDLFMMRKQLRTLKQYAERDAVRAATAGTR
jgi:hypothetical protein